MAGGQRKAVHLPGPHGGAAGRCVSVGGMVFTSGIPGLNAETRRLAATFKDEVGAAFGNLKAVLQSAGSGPAEIGLVNVALTEGQDARNLEAAWSGLFPDAANAPMRKINLYPLPDGQNIQVQAIGVRATARQIVETPGFAGAPPRGARLGNVVFSGEIDGLDPATGQPSDDADAEMRQAFVNLKAFIEAAGGGKEDLIHVFIFVRGREDQQDMLAAWLEAFPEDGNRPARKAIFDPTLTAEGRRIRLLCVAALGGAGRENLEVPGISKRHPNPMGCKIGNLVFSSGVGGDDPSGQATGQDAALRARLALRNMQSLLGAAGGGLDDIGMVAITVNDYADEAAIIREWDRTFPDPDTAPARHVMAFGGRGSYPVQLHVIAALPQA
jgi:2-iminobutanoate/2-iminopropanoate deaminase